MIASNNFLMRLFLWRHVKLRRVEEAMDEWKWSKMWGQERGVTWIKNSLAPSPDERR
jgi:hypothetical protein